MIKKTYFFVLVVNNFEENFVWLSLDLSSYDIIDYTRYKHQQHNIMKIVHGATCFLEKDLVKTFLHFLILFYKKTFFELISSILISNNIEKVFIIHQMQYNPRK